MGIYSIRIFHKLTIFQVSSWVTNIGEEFLTVHVNLGTSSTAAKEFCEDHGQLMDELKVCVHGI